MLAAITIIILYQVYHLIFTVIQQNEYYYSNLVNEEKGYVYI